MFISLSAIVLLAVASTCNGANSCIPTITWMDCANCPATQKDACFLVNFNDGGRNDVMCLQKKGNACIFSGNLLTDKSFVAVTGSDLSKCTPFSDDALDVSMSTDRCSGSFHINDGVATKPEGPFSNGNSDIALEVPAQVQPGELRRGRARNNY